MTRGGEFRPGHDMRRGRAYDEGRALVEAAREELAAGHPMTLRQVYYRLVSRQLLPNSDRSYGRLGELLVRARKEGRVPWAWVEDRLREPRVAPSWSDLDDFADAAARSYRRDVWASQPSLVEVMVEKDALSGIFEAELDRYGVTLNVDRGYGSWSSVREMAGRWGDGGGVVLLCFTDFDPSGEDMPRSLEERLAHFGCRPEIVKVALSIRDVEEFDLPTDPTKASDSRAAAFVRRYGDRQTELDALPPAVLRDRVREAVESRLDLDALGETRRAEQLERASLVKLLRGV